MSEYLEKSRDHTMMMIDCDCDGPVRALGTGYFCHTEAVAS
jgi:hypothetical protein